MAHKQEYMRLREASTAPDSNHWWAASLRGMAGVQCSATKVLMVCDIGACCIPEGTIACMLM